MSEETSPVEAEIYPPKLGDLEADPKVWMKVNCDLQFMESDGSKILKITPSVGDDEFQHLEDASKYEALDLEESEWKSFVFTHANHLSNLESATLTLYQDVGYWEKDIFPDLSGDWKTLEYILPSAAPDGYWKEIGLPTRIKYVIFKFSGKSNELSGSFEIKKAHLVRASPKT